MPKNQYSTAMIATTNSPAMKMGCCRRFRALAHFLQIAQRDQQVLFIHVEGLIGFHAHDGQIDRPQTQLGENARQNGGNAAAPCAKGRSASPGQHSGQNGAQKRQPDVAAAQRSA